MIGLMALFVLAYVVGCVLWEMISPPSRVLFEEDGNYEL